MIFADASALIAIIVGEPEADALADVLESERARLCSALSAWETIAGLCRTHMFPCQPPAFISGASSVDAPAAAVHSAQGYDSLKDFW